MMMEAEKASQLFKQRANDAAKVTDTTLTPQPSPLSPQPSPLNPHLLLISHLPSARRHRIFFFLRLHAFMTMAYCCHI